MLTLIVDKFSFACLLLLALNLF